MAEGPYRILLTAAGGTLSPFLIRLLKDSPRHDIFVIGADARADSVGSQMADAFSQVPPGSEPGYATAVLDIAVRHGARLVLPCSDDEVAATAAIAEEFQKSGIVLACPPRENLDLILDKAATYRHLQAAGLPTPAWKIADNRDALLDSVESFRATHGEFVVKPARGRGGRGVYIIRSDVRGTHFMDDARDTIVDYKTFRDEHLQKALTHLPLIIMERLGGPGWDIDVLSQDGRVRRYVSRRRFVPSGTPFKGSTICDPATFRSLVPEVARLFGLSWLQDFDLMTDSKGQAQFTEINPRPSGGVVAAVAAGVPILDDLISLAKGEPLPDVPIPEETSVVPYQAVIALRTAR